MSQLPVWLLATAFVGAAVVVWFAGSHLARYVDAISDKTGIGSAFAGMLLLGGITSLPELGAVTTSSITGNAALAINNLLGSLSLNLVLLVVADALTKRTALTSIVSGPSVLLQGVLGIVLLLILTVAIATGDFAIGPVGLGSIVIAAGVILAMRLASQYGKRDPWRVDRAPDDAGTSVESYGAVSHAAQELSVRALTVRTSLAALAVIGGGYLLSMSADGVAEQLGLDSGIVGLLLVGFATSLPELSTITAAVRLGRYEMAIGDVFGTNIFNLSIFLVADLFYDGGPVLGEAGLFEIVATLMAAVMTGLFVVGLLERRDRQLVRLGHDSFAVIAAFIAGLTILAFINWG